METTRSETIQVCVVTLSILAFFALIIGAIFQGNANYQDGGAICDYLGNAKLLDVHSRELCEPFNYNENEN